MAKPWVVPPAGPMGTAGGNAIEPMDDDVSEKKANGQGKTDDNGRSVLVPGQRASGTQPKKADADTGGK